MAESVKRIVIVGTDTDVGKTFIGVRLVRALREKGYRVGVSKPIESGCIREDDALIPADATALAEAAGLPDTSLVCPWPLPQPVAPAAEISRLGLRITAADVVGAIHAAAEDRQVVIVETAGGVLSPITPSLSSADFATLLPSDVVLVARSRLGVISHTVSALESLRSRGVQVRALVLNEADDGVDHTLNAEWIERGSPGTRIVRYSDDVTALVDALGL